MVADQHRLFAVPCGAPAPISTSLCETGIILTLLQFFYLPVEGTSKVAFWPSPAAARR
jgi:hypothetical protein